MEVLESVEAFHTLTPTENRNPKSQMPHQPFAPSRQPKVWSSCSSLVLAQRWICLGVLGAAAVCFAADVVPLPRAHAHNDYEHSRPLLDALDLGFCSVEADIFLVDGQLLVAHNRSDVRLERTIEKLYLDPLEQRVRMHNGSVHAQPAPFHLLIDLKTDGVATYAVLRGTLARYRSMLTEFGPQGIRTNAVTVILSGNRPREVLASENVRYAALDGRLTDLGANPPVKLVPWISDNWAVHFAWRGSGPFPDDQAARLKDYVRQIQGQGRRVRFWGTPDIPVAWKVLLDAGVDVLNTDDLAGLERFLRGR